jgi:ABC-type nitrate/sulfonate/bicarbonate transport system permease component
MIASNGGMGSRLRDAWPPALLLGGLVALWEVSPSLGVLPAIVPPPSLVLKTLIDKHQVYVDNLSVTLVEIALGFAVGFAIGLVVGVVIVYGRLAGQVLQPLIVTSQAIPVISLAPLLVILMGFGMEPRIVIVALAVFFPITLNTVAGLRSADRETVDLLKSYGASRRMIFRWIELPSALPFILAGVQLGLTYSVIGAVVAEWVGSGRGLGKLMLLRQSSFGVEVTYAAVALTAVVALVLLGGVQVIRTRLMPWEIARRADA